MVVRVAIQSVLTRQLGQTELLVLGVCDQDHFLPTTIRHQDPQAKAYSGVHLMLLIVLGVCAVLQLAEVVVVHVPAVCAGQGPAGWAA